MGGGWAVAGTGLGVLPTSSLVLSCQSLSLDPFVLQMMDLVFHRKPSCCHFMPPRDLICHKIPIFKTFRVELILSIVGSGDKETCILIAGMYSGFCFIHSTFAFIKYFYFCTMNTTGSFFSLKVLSPYFER